MTDITDNITTLATTVPPYAQELSKRMDHVFERLKESRKVSVVPYVKEFIREVILESIRFREEEWKHKCDLNCSFQADIEEILEYSMESVYEVLSNANLDEYDGQSFISIASTLEAIHEGWCQIFPFCK